MDLQRADGFTLSDDKRRLDLDRIAVWLGDESYWAAGRPRHVVEASIAGSDAYGVYAPGGAQVAFCRMISDRATFGYLCDVYVDSTHRGRGLGKWMIPAVRDVYLDLGVKRLILATRDAHGLYAGAGYEVLPRPAEWMWWSAPPQ